MFTALKPTESDIINHLLVQRNEPFSYTVGATLGEPPVGFDTDRHRVVLGHGEEVFHAGCEAIRQWRMFPTAMAELFWPDRPVEEGTTVDVLFRAGPFWSLNPARIVYTVDEKRDGVERFGFAYGTLPDHLEKGEESFMVEWNREDDTVYYELYAVSQARHAIAWLGYPYVRFCQARFRKLSGESMQSAVMEILQPHREDSRCYLPQPS